MLWGEYGMDYCEVHLVVRIRDGHYFEWISIYLEFLVTKREMIAMILLVHGIP